MSGPTKVSPGYRRLIRHLIRLRNQAGLTQKEVAFKLGTSQQRISKLETFETMMTLVDLDRLCGIYHVDIVEILRLLNPPP